VIHAVLHKALAHATYLNLITRNVSAIARTSLPRQQRYEYPTLTREQAQNFWSTVRGHRLEALLILAITTAMRRGELVALRWRDVRLQERYLQVRYSAQTRCRVGLQITEPKRKRGAKNRADTFPHRSAHAASHSPGSREASGRCCLERARPCLLSPGWNVLEP